jgi:hypothetical protein
MTLKSPAQAMLWRCWRLSWKPALLCQAGLYLLLIPFLLLLQPEDSESLNGVISASLLGYLVFLWASTLRLTVQRPNTWNTTGYQYDYELRLPVSVAQLVLIPLAWLTALFLAAYLLPALLLRWLFGFNGPSLVFSLLMIEFVLLLTAATWWSSDAWDGIVSWLAFVGSFMLGWLFPDFIQSSESDTGAVSVQQFSPASVLHYCLIIAACLTLTLLGVSKQRHGENLLGLSQWRLFDANSGLVGLASLPFMKGPCPTASPWRAELWRLQRFRGLSNYALFGLIAALFPCLLLGSVSFFNSSEEAIPLEPLLGSSGLALTMLAIAPAMSFYGMRTINHTLQFGLFERIRPLSTATLCGINFLILVVGLLSAALSMLLFLNLLGPLFISNFTELSEQFMSQVSSWMQQDLRHWLPPLLLAPVYLLMFAVLMATFGSWTKLQPRRCSLIVLALLFYILLLLIALLFLNWHTLAGLTAVAVWQIHLWLLLIALAGVAVYAWRQLDRDQVLEPVQKISLALLATPVLALSLFSFDLNWLLEAGFSNALQTALQLALGLLPLITAIFCLFTMNRVLHQ